MKKSIVILAMALFMTACATVQLTDAESEYLASIATETNMVFIAKENIDDAWGRANSYVVKNSSMKIQTANDHLIDTYNPSLGNSSIYSTVYGYTVTKTPVNGGYEIEIKCKREGGIALDNKACAQNEKIFSNYLRTGKLPYPNLVAK